MKKLVSAEKMFGLLSAISLVRVALDQTIIYGFSQPYNTLMSQLHMYMYLFILYLCMPAFALFLLGVRNKEKYAEVRQLYQSSVWIWAIIYPAVPIVSYIFKTPYRDTFEWMGYIPTFMVHNNYLPAGMIFVIPIIVYHYTTSLMQIFKFSFIKSFLAFNVSCGVLYVLFYQYLLNLGYHIWHATNFECFIGIYGILSVIVALGGLFYFNSYFEEQKKTWTGYFVVKTIIFAGITVLGFVKAFQAI